MCLYIIKLSVNSIREKNDWIQEIENKINIFYDKIVLAHSVAS